MSDNSKALAAPQSAPTTGALIAAVIESGMTTTSVEVIERLVALKEREDKAAAEREFAAAFAKLQSELPPIQATRVVKNRDGTPRYIYAPYEEIMEKARPFLTANGFGIRFDTESKDDKRVEVICTLIHKGGHRESNKQAVRIGSGPPGSSEAQGDGAATTYAKRFALCAALNITVEQDSDGGRNEGDGARITKEQAEDFRVRCERTKTGALKFIRWLAGEDATTFEEIPAVNWERGDKELKSRESK